MRNQTKKSDNSSGITGVHWDGRKKRWIVRGVSLNGDRVYLGSYKTTDEAGSAREAWLSNETSYTKRHGK